MSPTDNHQSPPVFCHESGATWGRAPRTPGDTRLKWCVPWSRCVSSGTPSGDSARMGTCLLSFFASLLASGWPPRGVRPFSRPPPTPFGDLRPFSGPLCPSSAPLWGEISSPAQRAVVLTWGALHLLFTCMKQHELAPSLNFHTQPIHQELTCRHAQGKVSTRFPSPCFGDQLSCLFFCCSSGSEHAQTFSTQRPLTPQDAPGRMVD